MGVRSLMRQLSPTRYPAQITEGFHESPSHNRTTRVTDRRHPDPRGAAPAELHRGILSDHYRTAGIVWQRYSSSALVGDEISHKPRPPCGNVAILQRFENHVSFKPDRVCSLAHGHARSDPAPSPYRWRLAA